MSGLGSRTTETPDAVRVEVRNGTPWLYFPDGDEPSGESCREATVAEWRFWNRCVRAEEALRWLEERCKTEPDLQLACALDELEAMTEPLAGENKPA